MKNLASVSLLLIFSAATLRAQESPATAPVSSNKAAVPITEEPHHHVILENSYVRVLRVEIISPDATLLHHHDGPYAYIAIGKADFTNAVEGKPEARVKLADGQLGYSKGGFSHIVRTENGVSFRNITIELLHPQGNIRSDCAKIAQGPPMGCPNAPAAADGIDSPTVAAGPLSFAPVLETDECVWKSASFRPDAETSLEAGPGGTLLVAELQSQFRIVFSEESAKLLSGGDAVWLKAGSTTKVKNSADQTSSLLILGFKDAPKAAAK